MQIKGFNLASPKPVGLSYLPLAHMLERTRLVSLNFIDTYLFWKNLVSTKMMNLLCGGQVGFYSGDVMNLLSELYCLKIAETSFIPEDILI